MSSKTYTVTTVVNGIEQREGSRGNFWIVQTSYDNMATFDTKVQQAITEQGYPGTFELEVQETEKNGKTYKNVQSAKPSDGATDAPANTQATQSSSAPKPSPQKKAGPEQAASYLVSYAKDLTCKLIESGQVTTEHEAEEAVGNLSLNLVKVFKETQDELKKSE